MDWRHRLLVRTGLIREFGSDLLGTPAKVVVGNHYRETGEVEIEDRDGESRSVASESVADAVEQFAAGE